MAHLHFGLHQDLNVQIAIAVGRVNRGLNAAHAPLGALLAFLNRSLTRPSGRWKTRRAYSTINRGAPGPAHTCLYSVNLGVFNDLLAENRRIFAASAPRPVLSRPLAREQKL